MRCGDCCLVKMLNRRSKAIPLHRKRLAQHSETRKEPHDTGSNHATALD